VARSVGKPKTRKHRRARRRVIVLTDVYVLDLGGGVEQVVRSWFGVR
jgi:hypothetical protein